MNTLYNTVNSELELLSQWYMANKLSLNTSKTQYVLFSKDGRQTYDNIVIRINGNSINSTNTANFLGLTIDNKLTWEYHIRSCKKRISSGLYALNTAKQFVSEAHLRTLYFSLMHSHITYGILLWGTTYQKYLHPLEILQKKAIRIITRSPYNAHTAELFKRLNILKFHDLVNFEMDRFIYQFSTKSLPNVLITIFVANDYVHNYATRQHREPRISIHKSRQTSNSFMCRGPKIWHSHKIQKLLVLWMHLNQSWRKKTIYLHINDVSLRYYQAYHVSASYYPNKLSNWNQSTYNTGSLSGVNMFEPTVCPGGQHAAANRACRWLIAYCT